MRKKKISLQKGQKMRIINLVENELGDSGCEAAHGLSFYIETENHKLLFVRGFKRFKFYHNLFLF